MSDHRDIDRRWLEALSVGDELAIAALPDELRCVVERYARAEPSEPPDLDDLLGDRKDEIRSEVRDETVTMVVDFLKKRGYEEAANLVDNEDFDP